MKIKFDLDVDCGFGGRSLKEVWYDVLFSKFMHNFVLLFRMASLVVLWCYAATISLWLWLPCAPLFFICLLHSFTANYACNSDGKTADEMRAIHRLNMLGKEQ